MSPPLAFDEVRDRRLVAAIRAPSTAAALGAANAIAEGGIPIVEITFTVPGAEVAIAELAGRSDLVVGAGTVLTAAQAHDAIAAGATFIIAPNLSLEVARIALDAGVMYCPGAYTTTEIVAARAAGAHLIKVYPVGIAGGPDYIKVVRDPLPDIPMLAAGGTNLDNVVPFLEVGCVAIGLGGALCDPKLVAAGKFDQLTKRAKEFVKKIAGAPKMAVASALFALATLAAVSAPGGLGPSSARAGTEEFSTFDVEALEEDDESLLDHVLLRPPRAWRTEWERAPQAIRTSQGCLTSGQWFIDTDLKLRSPLGKRAEFGLDLRQSESDVSSYEYLDFSFTFATRAWGSPGVMFRPLFDKSRQDLALFWQAGHDTSTTQFQAIFTFEDLFNNFWEFRQSRVGEESEPYERHPYEPALRFATRGDRVRLEIAGKYLTPSRKRIDPFAGDPGRITTLWGALATASVETRVLGLDWEVRGLNQQAASSDAPLDGSAGDARNVRRLWSAEVSSRRALGRRVSAEARWIYQERDQSYGGPIGPATLGAVDRLLQLDAVVALSRNWSARVGGMQDRITVGRTGTSRFFSYGTRDESRAYVALLARFGRVSVQAIEGLELNPEPYDVWMVHDKGFLHLQTTF
jgi:2-dehydro-3-deoxyphosphogluconate aldolase/(4S)-4-hydroxy-2-oxoglutarate aldolase